MDSDACRWEERFEQLVVIFCSIAEKGGEGEYARVATKQVQRIFVEMNSVRWQNM